MLTLLVFGYKLLVLAAPAVLVRLVAGATVDASSAASIAATASIVANPAADTSLSEVDVSFETLLGSDAPVSLCSMLNGRMFDWKGLC